MRAATQYRYKGPQKETNHMPSKTIPDQTMSIRELMLRQKSGIPITVKQAMYHDEKYIDDETGKNPASMDISEIAEELTRLEEKIKADRLRQLRELSEKRKRDFEESEKTKRQQWIKEYQEEQAKLNKQS